MSTSNQTRAAVRVALVAALLAQSQTVGAVLPTPVQKDGKMVQIDGQALKTRLAVMPERSSPEERYISGETETGYRLVIEWECWCPAPLDKSGERLASIVAGEKEIETAVTSDETFGGVCIGSEIIDVFENDEDVGRAGQISGSYIVIDFQLDARSALS